MIEIKFCPFPVVFLNKESCKKDIKFIHSLFTIYKDLVHDSNYEHLWIIYHMIWYWQYYPQGLWYVARGYLRRGKKIQQINQFNKVAYKYWQNGI